MPLHGRLPAAEQDAALRPGPRRRVVLATAVAESSLTVPGVRAVVDAGLARMPRIDHRRGLAGLVTVRVSAAVAEQRAGRAGREAPGGSTAAGRAGELLARYPEPEIRTADLTRLALELACWGTPDGDGLRWWDPPPTGPLRAGQQVLRALGAVDDGGVTDRGRRMAELGLHPRLARALLDGAALVGARAAAEVVALLDDDTLAEGVDVDDALRGCGPGRRAAPRAGGPRSRGCSACCPAILRSAERGSRGGDLGLGSQQDDRLRPAAAPRRPSSPWRIPNAGASPLRRPGSAAVHRDVYLMAGGTAAELPAGQPADRPGVARGRRRRPRRRARARPDPAGRRRPTVSWPSWRRRPCCPRPTRWAGSTATCRPAGSAGSARSCWPSAGSTAPTRRPSRAALRARAARRGPGLLRWTEHARRLRDRLPAAPHARRPLARRLRRRAAGRPRSAGGPARSPAPAAGPTWPGSTPPRCLRALLDPGSPPGWTSWPRSGSRCPPVARITLDYSGDQPVLAVRVQEVFGWTASPTVADGRMPVLLHLLSPAGRPAAVTADLTSFWATGYPQVRAELRGRYPKHAWPEDPLRAPTRPPRSPG